MADLIAASRDLTSLSLSELIDDFLSSIPNFNDLSKDKRAAVVSALAKKGKARVRQELAHLGFVDERLESTVGYIKALRSRFPKDSRGREKASKGPGRRIGLLVELATAVFILSRKEPTIWRIARDTVVLMRPKGQRQRTPKARSEVNDHELVKQLVRRLSGNCAKSALSDYLKQVEYEVEAAGSDQTQLLRIAIKKLGQATTHTAELAKAKEALVLIESHAAFSQAVDETTVAAYRQILTEWENDGRSGLTSHSLSQERHFVRSYPPLLRARILSIRPLLRRARAEFDMFETPNGRS